jgi:hypothetical protein
MSALRLAYVANIVILVPIAVPTVFRLFPTDQGAFVESAGWRVLIGGVWLAVYAAPRLLRGDLASVPWEIAASFAVIVLLWPFVIPWKHLLESRE